MPIRAVHDGEPGGSTMVTRLREAERASGIFSEDPLWVLIEAMAQTISELDDQRIAMTMSATEIVGRLADLLKVGRDTAQAEADTIRITTQAAEAAFVNLVAESCAKAAAAALARRARIVDRRGAAVIGLGLLGALGMGALTGCVIGDRTARTAMAKVASDLDAAAFREGPEAAGIWIELMQWNDPRSSLQVCRNASEIQVQNGRRACRVPLWIEKPLPLEH